MARDIKKERIWLNENYKRLEVRVKKDMAQRFIEKIDMPFSTWAKEKIHEELMK